MALQVWLSLNGNVNNQGLADITATNSGATVDSNGKIGQCYSFDGSDDYINIGDIGKYFDGTAFSICFWIYSLEDKTRAAVFSSYGLSSTSNFFALEINSSNATYCKNNLRFDWKGTDTYSPDDFITYDDWTHVCVTYDGVNKIKMYKNGELVQTTTRVLPEIPTGNTYYLGRDSRTGTTAFNGRLNDFRIYDHCLSPRECKQVSTTLVLHLPLDRDGLGMANLITNSRLQTSTDEWVVGGAGADNCNLTVKDGFQCMHVAGELGTTAYLSPKYTIEADNAGFVPYNGMTITMSADVLLENVTKGTTNYFLAFYGSGQTIDGHWRDVSIVSCSEHFIIVPMPSAIVGTAIVGAAMLSADGYISAKSSAFDPDKLNGVGWVRAYVTFRYGDYAWTSHLRPNIYCRDFTGDFYVKNVKVEYGNKATPWCPNEADDLYTQMGLDNNIEYDVSGYRHNGTKVGSITYDSDTPRYNTSAVLDGSYITLTGITDSAISQFSVCGWVNLLTGYKPNLGCHLINFSKQYCRICISKDGAAVRLLLTDGTTNYSGSSAMSASGLSANVWNHYAVTFDNGSIKIYINGELDSSRTATITSISPGTSWTIGNYATELPKAKVSDVRFYTTCLNELDVRELYNTSMSLSDNGLLFGYEFIG